MIKRSVKYGIFVLELPASIGIHKCSFNLASAASASASIDGRGPDRNFGLSGLSMPLVNSTKFRHK